MNFFRVILFLIMIFCGMHRIEPSVEKQQKTTQQLYGNELKEFFRCYPVSGIVLLGSLLGCAYKDIFFKKAQRELTQSERNIVLPILTRVIGEQAAKMFFWVLLIIKNLVPLFVMAFLTMK